MQWLPAFFRASWLFDWDCVQILSAPLEHSKWVDTALLNFVSRDLQKSDNSIKTIAYSLLDITKHTGIRYRLVPWDSSLLLDEAFELRGEGWLEPAFLSWDDLWVEDELPVHGALALPLVRRLLVSLITTDGSYNLHKKRSKITWKSGLGFEVSQNKSQAGAQCVMCKRHQVD